MKLIVTGHGEHGKDTVCEMLTPYLNFKSSSRQACELIVFPALKEALGYTTAEECFEDRRNHRSKWYTLIREFNREDGTALGRAIFEDADIYCGLRSLEEYEALKQAGLVDYLIWVDASERVPPESPTSISITKSHADIIIDNNGTVEELPSKVDAVFNSIFGHKL